VDRDRARQTGAAIGEKVAVGASRAEQAIADSTLTAKIKSKIALDDTLRGTRVNVDSHGTEVTLRGSVASGAQRARVLQLARETAGVTSVDDQLDVRP
jgi:osmotically-inducible protein OsmY